MITEKLLYAIISPASALVGVGLTLLCTELSARKSRAQSDVAQQRRLVEQHYLDVMTSIELFVRSKSEGYEIVEQISRLNAVIKLYGSFKVREAFLSMSDRVDEYSAVLRSKGFSGAWIMDGRDLAPVEWDALIESTKELFEEMREHIVQLGSVKA